jgi:hypothetical protein
VRKITVGNPISLILGYSYGRKSLNYFVVQEASDLRPSHRDTSLALVLQKAIASFFDIDVQVISFEQFEYGYVRDVDSVTEFRYINHFRKKYANLNLPSVEAISYGADVLLANSNLKEMLRGPRSFRVINAWKSELNKNPNISKLLIPEINSELISLLDIPVKQIPRGRLELNLRNFSKSSQFSEFIECSHVETYPLIVVGPDYYGFDTQNVDALISSIREIPNSDHYQILVKPHPASDISTEMMNYFEHQLGRPTLNKTLKLDINRVKTAPLEILMAANNANLYVGIYTAGIAGVDRHRVFWVPSSDKFSEKMYKINYRKFLEYWSDS